MESSYTNEKNNILMLMNRTFNISLWLKPPPFRIKTPSLIKAELNKPNNKFLFIMIAIVKVKKLEIKVKAKLHKSKKLRFFSMNKILNFKQTQSTAYINNSGYKTPTLIDSSSNLRLKSGQRSAMKATSTIIRSNALIDDSNSYMNHNEAEHTTYHALNGAQSGSTAKISSVASSTGFYYDPKSAKMHKYVQKSANNSNNTTNNNNSNYYSNANYIKRPSKSQQLTANLPLLKHNYYLKTDFIYGDKKLKMSGKHVLPQQLPKDLKNINRLVKLAHAMHAAKINDENQEETGNKSTINQDMAINRINNHHKNGNNNQLHSQSQRFIANGNSTTQLNSSTTNMASLSSSNLNKPERFDYKAALNAQIDKNIKNLQELVVLDLSTERQSCLNFPLIQIPVELFKLSQLKRLHFDCNQIKYIPDEFGTAMVNLETLTISNNRLKWLPITFKNMRKLQSLHLSHNRFDIFPMVLCEMPRLRFLDLSSNNIDDLPKEIGNLNELESLLLFHNNIKEVPTTIGKLVNLRTLWLGENKIKKLPLEISLLKNLDWTEDDYNLSSHINGNPLVDPPMNVCAKGVKAIRSYFEERDRNSEIAPPTSIVTTALSQSQSKNQSRSQSQSKSQLSYNYDKLRDNNNSSIMSTV